MFSESRFVSTDDGQVFADGTATAGYGWAERLSSVPNLRLAARVRPGSAEGLFAVSGDSCALPYYQGVGQMLIKLPQLIRHINRLTAESSAVVVKQPGIIGIIATAAATLHRKPVVAQVVGDIDGVLRSGVAGRLGQTFARAATAITRRTIWRARAVRYVTSETLQRKYPPNPIALAISCSDVYLHDDIPLRAREPEHFKIVAVGSQENSYKGHQDLIQATASLLKTYPTLELRLVGDGRYQPTLRELCTKLGVTKEVTFAGFIGSRELIAHELDASTIFVLPSHTEGLPRALIEAMARALPCVSTDVGGIPELLGPQWCVRPGQPSELADRVAKFLENAELRSAEGQRNFDKSRDFVGDRQKHSIQQWQDAVMSVVTQERQR